MPFRSIKILRLGLSRLYSLSLERISVILNSKLFALFVRPTYMRDAPRAPRSLVTALCKVFRWIFFCSAARILRCGARKMLMVNRRLGFTGRYVRCYVILCKVFRRNILRSLRGAVV